MNSMCLPSLSVNTSLEQLLKLLKSTSVYCGKCIIMITALLQVPLCGICQCEASHSLILRELSRVPVGYHQQKERKQLTPCKMGIIPILLVSLSWKRKCGHTQNVETFKLKVNRGVYILQLKSVMKLHFRQNWGKNEGLTLLILSFL